MLFYHIPRTLQMKINTIYDKKTPETLPFTRDLPWFGNQVDQIFDMYKYYYKYLRYVSFESVKFLGGEFKNDSKINVFYGLSQ